MKNAEEGSENRAIKNAQAAIVKNVYIPKEARGKVRAVVVDGRLTLTSN